MISQSPEHILRDWSDNEMKTTLKNFYISYLFMTFFRYRILRRCWVIDDFKILLLLEKFTDPVHLSACWTISIKLNLK